MERSGESKTKRYVERLIDEEMRKEYHLLKGVRYVRYSVDANDKRDSDYEFLTQCMPWDKLRKIRYIRNSDWAPIYISYSLLHNILHGNITVINPKYDMNYIITFDAIYKYGKLDGIFRKTITSIIPGEYYCQIGCLYRNGKMFKILDELESPKSK